MPAKPTPPTDLRAAYRRLFNTPDGKLILADMRRASRYGLPAFHWENGLTCPIKAAFRNGQQMFYQSILETLAEPENNTKPNITNGLQIQD